MIQLVINIPDGNLREQAKLYQKHHGSYQINK